MLAQAFDNLGASEDAIVTYFQVYSSYRAYLSVAAPSLKRYMELLWARNKPATKKSPADRQFAYEFGYKYIQASADIPNNDRVPEEEKDLWKEVQKLVRSYEANPATKAIEKDS